MNRHVTLNVALIVIWVQVLHYLHATQYTFAPYDLYRSGRWTWSALLALLIGVASYVAGLPEAATGRRDAVVRMGASIAVAIGAVSLIQLGLGSALLPRFVVGMAAITLLPWSVIAWNLAGDRAARKASVARVLAVVEPDLGADLRSDLALARTPGVTIVDMRSPAELTGDGRTRPLVDLARELDASILVIDGMAQATASIVKQAATLHEDGIRVRSLSLFYEEWLDKLPLADLERVALMFDIQEVHHALYGRAKRIVDSTVALLLVPFLVVVAAVTWIANRFGDGGPLFYRQTRVGKDNVPFEMLKFRTMSVAGAGGDRDEWTTDDDPRITRIGRILRRSHLDELPQIVNIFRGELSIVGPRPEQEAYVAELSEKFELYGMRHLVRPGLTGWAQVNLGYTASESDALQKLQYDFYYLRHQGLWCDLNVLLRTFRLDVLLGGR